MVYKTIWLVQTFFLRLLIKKIGLLSYVAKPAFITGGANIKIGNKVRIFPRSRMECHNNGKITIENNTSIGQNLHLISSTEELVIGNNTTISGNVFITNMDHEFRHIDKHILEQDYIIKTTRIGQNCFIGYGAVIQAGTILGKQCIVGSNSVVRGIFPDYCVIVGAPAKIVKRYNAESGNWDKTDHAGNFIIK
jgi:acetyltransferase-like isoleucine patch superfamily enzyme